MTKRSLLDALAPYPDSMEVVYAESAWYGKEDPLFMAIFPSRIEQVRKVSGVLVLSEGPIVTNLGVMGV
jgi:hypothetical protein